MRYTKNEEKLSINISNPTRQNFSELIEYNLFVSELKQSMKFREWLSGAPLDQIAKMLEQNKISTKVVLEEIMRV